MKKFGEIFLQVVNGGLKIITDGKEQRLDPAESTALLQYLDEHRADFQKALRPDAAEPAVLSKQWYDQKLDGAFENMPE